MGKPVEPYSNEAIEQNDAKEDEPGPESKENNFTKQDEANANESIELNHTTPDALKSESNESIEQNDAKPDELEQKSNETIEQNDATSYKPESEFEESIKQNYT